MSALRSEGVLWLVNAVVFHPRGVQFGLVSDPDGETVGWDLSVGPDVGPCHHELDAATEAARMAAVEDLIARVRAGGAW